MTYLAVSTNTGDPSAYVGAETGRIAELVDSGIVEQMWLKSDWSGAVLLLSSAAEGDARAALDTLPITRAGLNGWALTEVVSPPTGV